MMMLFAGEVKSLLGYISGRFLIMHVGNPPFLLLLALANRYIVKNKSAHFIPFLDRGDAASSCSSALPAPES